MNYLKKWRQILPTVVASLGATTQGMSIAFTSSALPQMTAPGASFFLTESQASLMVAMLMITAAAGAIIVAAVENLVSRKELLVITAVLGLFGFIFTATASNFTHLLVGRAMLGIASGANFPITPVYISEITEPEMRSSLATFPVLFLGIGSLLEYILGMITPNWRVMTWAGTVVPALFMLFMPFMPRSPRYLLMKGKDEEAAQTLSLLMGKEANAKEEIVIIKKHLAEAASSTNIIQTLSKNYVSRALSYGAVMGFLFGSSGAVVFLSYIEPLSIMMKSAISPKVVSVVIGFTMVGLSTLILPIANTFGRRRFLQVSGSLMCLSLVCQVVFFGIVLPNFPHRPDLLYFPPIFLILFMASFSIGYKTMSLAIVSEFLPCEIRAFGTSSCAILSTILNAILSYSFTSMTKNLGLAGFFSIFSVVSLICALFPTFFLPETRGKSLEEIEKELKCDHILLGLHTE